MYGQPKLHKLVSLPDSTIGGVVNSKIPDGVKFRPIVNCKRSFNANLALLVHRLIQPLVLEFKYILKNSIQLINQIDFKLNEYQTFYTLDVVNLYPSIPHDLAITAVKYWMEKFNFKAPHPFTTEFILKSIGKKYIYNQKYIYK